MTDLEMFRAFLEQTGLAGQERPRQEIQNRQWIEPTMWDPVNRKEMPGRWIGGEWVDIPGTVVTLDYDSDKERWDGYGQFCFSISFDGDGKLLRFGAYE
jgi:hypothetical protein